MTSHLRGIVHLLRTIDLFNRKFKRDPYTRELLTFFKSWTYGHLLLKLAHSLGLVKRYVAICYPGSNRKCIFNTLTKLGRKLLKIIDELTTSESDDDT